jgi:flagellar export protein FliJ
MTLRTWEEERARSAYGQSFRQEQRFAASLRDSEGRIEAALSAWHAAPGDRVTAREHMQRWAHLLVLERERSETAQKLASARRIREQKMKLLVDAHRRVQVLDNLKSRQRQAHVAESRRREEKELDEIVNARFQPDF